MTDEEFWQEQKRFVLRHLKDFGFGRHTMASLVEEEAADIVNTFESIINKNGKNGEEIEMSHAFSVNVLNTLWMMMAGKRFTPQEQRLKELQFLLTDLLSSTDMVGALFSQFPVLQYLAPELSGYNKFLNLHKQLWAFLKVSLTLHYYDIYNMSN